MALIDSAYAILLADRSVIIIIMSSVYLSVWSLCDKVYCWWTIHPTAKVSEQVNWKCQEQILQLSATYRSAVSATAGLLVIVIN